MAATTVTYRHDWSAPYVVAIRPPNGMPTDMVWTSRQLCERCGTERNPLTARITRYGGSRDPRTGLHECQRPAVEIQAGGEEKALERIRMQLYALRSEGRLVRPSHPDPERRAQETFL